MEKQDVVSIWLGKFDSEKEFENYIKEQFPEEDDNDSVISSTFMEDFKIDYYDSQFFEAEYVAVNSIENMIDQLSYSQFFREKFIGITANYNAVIAVYNFEYDQKITVADKVKFINSFTYES